MEAIKKSSNNPKESQLKEELQKDIIKKDDLKIEDKNEDFQNTGETIEIFNDEDNLNIMTKIINDISIESTKEEVANFFKYNFDLNEEISNNFINEYISGDILPDLTFEDFKYLGLNIDSIINWNKYYEINEDKFKGNKIKENISSNSSSDEVNLFLNNYLDFKENLNNLNGQKLFELNEEDMKKLGMKLGQRKKLINYKIYEDEKSEGIFLNITDNNSIEEIQIKPKLNYKTKINFFITIGFEKNYFQNINMSFYCKNEKDLINKNYKYRIINKSIYKTISKNEKLELFLFKVELDDMIDNLNIKIQNDEEEN